MSASGVPGRRKLLMLSHVLPQAGGSSERRRAWQLLHAVQATHDVHLACLADGPVRLDQWSSLQDLVSGCVLDRASATARAGAWLLEPWNQAAADVARMGLALWPMTRTWLATHRFDMVLATHPALWPTAQSVPADLRLCDLHRPASQERHRLAREDESLRCWWHWRQFKQLDQSERRVARNCDVLTVSEAEDVRRLAAEPCRTLLLPTTSDRVSSRWILGEALEPTPSVLRLARAA